MACSCNINGIIGVRNGRAFQYAVGKQFWKHDGFLPLRNQDLEVDVFTFGGGSSGPLDDGVYFSAARVVARVTAGEDVQTTEPILQLFVNEGLVHNARVRVAAVHHRFIEVEFPDDPNSQAHCIPRISFNFSPPGSDWTVVRKQFPLRLAYATTFDGCQGLTLDCSVLDLRIDPFAHGQLYTALSRVRHRAHTMALFAESNKEQTCANVVYDKLLL